MQSRDDLKHRVAGERQAFASSLGSLVKVAPVVCEERRTAGEVARIMLSSEVGSVVVVSGDGRPVGIVTSRDLIEVVAAGSGERPVSDLMSRDLVSLAPSAFAYEAALAMTDRRIRHILVV